MLKLVAAALEDGWAFVETEGELLLVRPPYRQSMTRQVPQTALQTAVSTYGFEVRAETFDDWAALIEFLRARLIESREAAGQTQPQDSREILRRAPRSLLLKYLDRIEQELLPRREWQAVSNILGVLLESPGLHQDPQLHQRVVRLLARCNQEMAGYHGDRAALAGDLDLVRRFPRATQRNEPAEITTYARGIWERGQVLRICA
ncbi:MAG: hypothetical protein FJ291_31895 [Planctomycetes bacterium]|nr:hypothetical protein [Planctomycetota bacterium]